MDSHIDALLTTVQALSGLGAKMVLRDDSPAHADEALLEVACACFAASLLGPLSSNQTEALLPLCEPLLQDLYSDRDRVWRVRLAVTTAVYMEYTGRRDTANNNNTNQ
jgi:hypothetical protein